MLQDLSEWSHRLERLWSNGEVVDPLDVALLHARINYPELGIEPFEDMIKGMLMDIPDLGQDRYSTFQELHLYCYRVAGTVGLMSTPIFGTAEEWGWEEAKVRRGAKRRVERRVERVFYCAGDFALSFRYLHH